VGCIHRDIDDCKLTNSPCFGLVYSEQDEEYVIDPWKESMCNSFISDGKNAEISTKDEWNIKEGEKFSVLIRIFGSKEDSPSYCNNEICIPGEYRTPEEDAEILESLLNRRYSGGIKVEGFSLNSPRMSEFPEIRKLIEEGMEPPITMVNGEIKFIGDIQLNLLKLEIEKLGLKPR